MFTSYKKIILKFTSLTPYSLFLIPYSLFLTPHPLSPIPTYNSSGRKNCMLYNIYYIFCYWTISVNLTPKIKNTLILISERYLT